MKYLSAIIIIISLVLSLGPQTYGVQSDLQRYRKCIDLVTDNAGDAVKYANDWIFSGNGRTPASHCKALGLLALGKAREAAMLLEKLMDDMAVGASLGVMQTGNQAQLRVQLYIQTARAWKLAGKLDKSYIAYSSALADVSGDNSLGYDLYLARGTLQIRRGNYQAAIGDFTSAIEKKPGRFDAFLQRAKAFRKKHDFPGARLDLRMAVTLAPDQMDILLESGILYREKGQKLQARWAWQRIIDLYPASEYARLAQTNIDLLTQEKAP